MSHLPSLDDSIVDAIKNYRGNIAIGLYGNDPDPSLVDGLDLAGGGSGSGSGGGSLTNPLVEVSGVPGYMMAYPSDWRTEIDTGGNVGIRGTATFRCSGNLSANVKIYGWFAVIPRQGSDPTLLAFAPLQTPQSFRRAGDIITVPVSIFASQPDVNNPAIVTGDTDGDAFVVNLGKPIDGSIHTKSDVEFVSYLYRQLARIADHDLRALAPRLGSERTSPIPVIDTTNKALAVGLGLLKSRLSALHVLWTGRPLNY